MLELVGRKTKAPEDRQATEDVLDAADAIGLSQKSPSLRTSRGTGQPRVGQAVTMLREDDGRKQRTRELKTRN